jgi:hypothetical protein
VGHDTLKHDPDTYSIQDTRAYKAAIDTLNKRNRAPSVLRLIMNALESYRQARKIGWSRPWNKYGVKTFRSYRLDPGADTDLIDRARAVLRAEATDLPDEARAYVDDLFSDDTQTRKRLMGFLFYHEVIDAETDGGGVWEGVTLSFGRVNHKRHRDRFDLVFEGRVADGRVGPLSRLRMFVDPFHGVAPPLYQRTVTPAHAEAQETFETLCDLYAAWADTPQRAWDHWTSQYIDYFGPRRTFADGTRFPIGGA